MLLSGEASRQDPLLFYNEAKFSDSILGNEPKYQVLILFHDFFTVNKTQPLATTFRDTLPHPTISFV